MDIILNDKSDKIEPDTALLGPRDTYLSTLSGPKHTPWSFIILSSLAFVFLFFSACVGEVLSSLTFCPSRYTPVCQPRFVLSVHGLGPIGKTLTQQVTCLQSYLTRVYGTELEVGDAIYPGKSQK